MKIAFWSVGKCHEAYVRIGIEDFSKRINNYFKVEWEIIPSSKKSTIIEIKKSEGESILTKINKDDYLIALDERGTILTSEELSMKIQHCANMATKRLIFLIGGAYGLHDSVLKRANFQWSLSKLVFPHQLVRLILAEQVYRACTILKNEKYHHM